MNLKKSLHSLCLLLLLSLGASAQMATDITFNEIPPGGVHRATDKYIVTVNGVALPVVDGYCMENNKPTRGYLNYDYTTFSASLGKVTLRLQCKNDITAIQVSPLKLNIELRKIDNKTYEFDVPEPIGDEQYYLIAQINGSRLVVTRDPLETDVPQVGESGVFNIVDKLAGLDPTKMANAVGVAAAIQSAVNEASAYGTANNTQGVVYVPKGLFYMGNLKLKSNTALYLAPGSLLRFTDNFEDYKVDFKKESVNRNGTWWIYTEDKSKNIKIYGRGTIDGNGHYLSKDAPNNRRFANNMLMIMGTENFVFDGPILKEGALWGTIVARSNDVVFRNSKFFQSMDQGEDDGIDVCESQRVLVEKSIGISLDDPYSTKTWEQATDICPNWYGKPEVLEDVTFLNCVTLTYCGGFKCGHGAVQMQKNILVKNGVVVDAGWALGIEPKYSTSERISGFRDIRFENIDIERYGHEGWLQIRAERKDVGNPPLKGVVLKDINIRHRGPSGKVLGFDEDNLMEDITFDNITLYGNTIGATNFAQMNIMNTKFYKNVVFAQAPGNSSTLHIEAEYLNEWSGNLIMTENTGANSDLEYPLGRYISSIASNNYIRYQGVEFGSKTDKLILRASMLRNNTSVEVRIGDRINGQIIGTKEFMKDETGVWNNHEIVLEKASGQHDLFITFKHATAGTLPLCNLNFIELQNRVFYNLESMSPVKSALDVNVDESVSLEIAYLPENAYQKEVEWTVETGDGIVEVTKQGLVKGLKKGVATVKATSIFDNSISALFTINVIDLYVRDVLRIEAESSDGIYDTYHYDNAIAIGAITDPKDVGGSGINNCWNTNFAVYKNIDFKQNTIKATIRKGYPRGSKMELWIDRTIDKVAKTATGGKLIGSIEFPQAGTDWNRWQTFETEISGASGIHDLCLVFLAGGGSAANQNYGALNWIELTRVLADATGIERNEAMRVQTYPNPFIDQLKIDAESDILSLTITDVSGKVAYRNNHVNSVNCSIATSQWAKGVYLVQAKTAKGITTSKIVKK